MTTTARRDPLAARNEQPVALASEGKPREHLYPEDIRTDGGTQMRAGLNEETVSEYLDAITGPNVWPFPPVIVFYDGSVYWLGDGFHRVEAARRYAQREEIRYSIPADVRPGARRDAILWAAQANADHGLRRTNADKRRAVETLLRDDEWGAWSDGEIARKCKVSQPFVSKIRSEIHTHNGYESPEERTYIHPKTGQPTTMNVTGQRQAGQERSVSARMNQLVDAGWGFLHKAQPPYDDGMIEVWRPNNGGLLGRYPDGAKAVAAAGIEVEMAGIAKRAQAATETPAQQAPDPDDDIVLIACPRCGVEQQDLDGFGVLHCEACGYCAHFSATGGICDICGQPIRTAEPAPSDDLASGMMEAHGARFIPVDDAQASEPEPPPADELPADLVARGCRMEVKDGWYFVRYGHHFDTCASLESAIAWCRKITGTQPTPPQPTPHQQKQAALKEELEFWKGALSRAGRVGELTGVYTATGALQRAIEAVIRTYEGNVT